MKSRITWWGVALCALHTTPLYAQESEGADPAETTSDGSTAGSADAPDDAPPSGGESVEDTKRANARRLATEASQDYRMGSFQEAYDKFNRAFRLVEVPALGVWSARSLRQLHRLVEASERYREVIKKGAPSDAPEHAQSLRDAQAELDELLPRIPNLVIQLENAKAEEIEVRMDGEVVDPALVGTKMQANPGQRQIVARRGDETIEQTVTLRERATEEIVLKFKVGYVPPPEEGENVTINVQQGFTPLETVGIVVMSGAGVLLIAGGVTTGIALGQQADLRETCPSRECDPQFHEDVDKFNTMKTISTTALIGGAVLGGIGVALYIAGGKQKNEGVAMFVRGSTLGLSGTF